jgi:hypothetical protein
MFCGCAMMSSKSMVCISLKGSLSFMFEDFDTNNLASKYICLCCIMLHKKIELNYVYKIDKLFV